MKTPPKIYHDNMAQNLKRALEKRQYIEEQSNNSSTTLIGKNASKNQESKIFKTVKEKKTINVEFDASRKSFKKGGDVNLFQTHER